MVYNASLEAFKRNLSFACSPFDAKATGVATVEWVFYMSKVRFALNFVEP